MPNPIRMRRRLSNPGTVVKAARFVGGASQFMNITDNAALSMGAGVHPTFVFWVYPESLTASQGLLAKGLATTAANTEWMFNVGSAGGARIFVSDGTTVLNQSTAPMRLNAWNFVAGFYSGATFGVSLNNGAFTSFAFTTDIQDSTNATELGARSDNAQPFSGALNQVGIAKSVLSAAELTELYNGGKGKSFAQLSAALAAKFSAYWDLDDAGGSGAMWLDKASTNHLTAAAGAAAPTAVLLRR